MLIKTLLKALLMVTLLFSAHPSSAESNLDVMLVFSDDISLSSFEKTVVAARYQAVLSDVYGISGVPFTGQLDGVRSVEVWPLIFPEMSITASTKTNAEVLQWMIDENAKLLPVPSPLRAARESAGNPGADIILMVVPSTTDNDCGAAPSIPTLAGTFNSESNAFAIVYLKDMNPTCPEEIVVPHEVGHLLYAEHEIDTNSDNVSPSPDNHATTSTSSGQKTLMWDGIHPLGTEFLSGSSPTRTVPGWADNVDFFSDKSFDVVSAYRQPPPPPCVIDVVQWCNGNSPQASVTPTLAGHTMTNINLNYQLSGSSNLYPIYQGSPTCPIYNPPSTFMNSIVNALVETATQQLSGCSVTVTPMWCGNGDPL